MSQNNVITRILIIALFLQTAIRYEEAPHTHTELQTDRILFGQLNVSGVGEYADAVICERKQANYLIVPLQVSFLPCNFFAKNVICLSISQLDKKLTLFGKKLMRPGILLSQKCSEHTRPGN